jgi:predicted acylesterase/phospholipase RssA
MAKREHTILVLQGGGVLGAYQARVHEGIAETGPAIVQRTGFVQVFRISVE